MKSFFLGCILTLACLAMLFSPANSQGISSSMLEEAPYVVQKQYMPIKYQPPLMNKADTQSRTDWTSAIDSIWGPGQSVQDKLEIFDTYWKNIDWYFACFQDLEVDWDSLRTEYRNEILDTVSRGRFAAMLTHMSLLLKEAHTNCEDAWVCSNTASNPGTPLLWVGGWGDNGHFGAGLTPISDSSLLVYKVDEDHPLGIIPGDIVLGYNGTAWKDLYPQMIDAQLPIKGFWWGCSPSAYAHSWLMSAGLNWHLFDTIDILKFESGNTIHLPTQPLLTYSSNLRCSEQMDIPGVPFPDMDGGELCSHGIIENTQIGYIYVWGWFWDVSTEFYEAVYDIMYNHETIGLIIDFRMNYGGNMWDSDPGLNLLFNESVYTIGFDKRIDTADHLAMGPSAPPSYYVIHGDPASYYDKPIAVLTGPGAISSGDQVALRMKFHPEARFFGKSTTTAFNAPTTLDLGNSNYYCRYARSDAYLYSDPGHYLTHDEFIVDEEIWHNPEDVAVGKDAIVAAAMQWIDPTMGIYENYLDPQEDITELVNYPNPCNNNTTIYYTINSRQNISIKLYNNLGSCIKTLLRTRCEPGVHTLHLPTYDLPNGIYFYQLCGESSAITSRLIVQR